MGEPAAMTGRDLPVTPHASGHETKTAAPRRALPTTLLTSIFFRFGAVGLNAVTGIVTARALHPVGRGELAAMVIWPMLFSGLTTFGLPTALVYHIRREPHDRGPLIGWALLLCIVAALAGTAIGWHLVPIWLAQHPPHIVRAAQWCLLTTAISSLTLVGRAAWEANGQFTRSTLSQLVTPLFVILGLGVLVAGHTLTPVSAAAVYVLAGLPSLVWMLVSVSRASHPVLRGGRAVWGRLSHYGLRSCGVDLCGILAIYLDQALVVGLLSSESMGIYAVALSLSRVIGSVHASVAMMVFPKVVGLAPREMAVAVGRSARMGTIAAGGVGLLILAAGPTLLLWLYGPSYGASNHILPVLVLEAIVAGLAQVLLQGFLAAGRPGIATSVLAGGLVFSVPLFLLLVPAFGVLGASIALVAASSMRVVLTMVAYRSVLGQPVPRVWIGGADLAELGHYRGALVRSVLRFRATGESK